jgi:hypothetical protein
LITLLRKSLVLNSLQSVTITHLQDLSSQYQKVLTANTRMNYLKSYDTMLQLEIERLEALLYQKLLALKKSKRFLIIKKAIRGAYDLDNKIINLKSEIESLMITLKDKRKEREVSEFEMLVLTQLFDKSEYIQKEYKHKLGLVIANYKPKTIEEQVTLGAFERQINDLFIAHIKTAFIYDKLKELKDSLDKIHPLFMRIAYGYQVDNTPNYNLYGPNLVKTINELANTILNQVNEVWSDSNFSKLSIMALDREIIQINLRSLANLKLSFFNQDGKNTYPQYDNVLSSLRIKTWNDLKNVKRDLKVLEDKIDHHTKERQKWFKNLFKLV